MSMLLGSIFSKLWGKIAAAAAIVGAVLYFLLRVFQAGVTKEKLAQAERDEEARRVRDKEDRRAAGAVDPADELRKRWQRR